MFSPTGTAAVRVGRPGRTPAVWPGAIVLFVLAGSLSPYSFDLTAAREGGAWGPAAIGWPTSPLSDLVTNFVVYLPVGAALCLWWRRRVGLAGAVLLAVIVGGGVSLLAESLQTLVPQRTASWVDVGVNLMGTLFGAMLGPVLAFGARVIAARSRAAVSRAPLSAAAAVAALTILLTGLWPFDVVGSTRELHNSLVLGQWTALAPSQGDDLPIVTGHSLVPTLALAALFAVYGFLAALAERESGASRDRAAATAAIHAAILSLLVETVQVFVISRSFDALDATLNTAAALLGVYFALMAVDGPMQSRWLGRPSTLLHPALLVPALTAQIIYRLADSVAGATQRSAEAAEVTVVWVPFALSYGSSLTSVLADAVWASGLSALVVLTVAALTWSVDGRERWGLAVAVAVALAAASEAARLAWPSGAVDMTDPVWAACGALLAATTCRRMFIANQRPVSDTASLHGRGGSTNTRTCVTLSAGASGWGGQSRRDGSQ